MGGGPVGEKGLGLIKDETRRGYVGNGIVGSVSKRVIGKRNPHGGFFR